MNGKLQVMSAVLKKKDNPFKAPYVVESTGLSRQLVYKHLTALCDEGFLFKSGKSYAIRDEEGLLDSIVSHAESSNTRSFLMPGTLIDDVATEVYNQLAECLLCLEHLNIEEINTEALHESYLMKIDKTITGLKQLRKLVNNGERATRTTIKKLSDKETVKALYSIGQGVTGWKPNVSEADFLAYIADGIDELIT